MRRQPIGNFGNVHVHPLNDDLGWNDMGMDLEPAVEAAPIPAPVAEQQEPAPLQAFMPIPRPVPVARDLPEPEPVFEPEPVCEPEPVAAAPEPVVAAPEPVAVAPEPVAPEPISPISQQLAVLAERINARPAPDRKARVRPVEISGGNRKAAFTLRLDPERHLRLRLLSAVSNRSAQHLMIEALDLLIDRNDALEDLAGRVETRTRAAAGKRG